MTEKMKDLLCKMEEISERFFDKVHNKIISGEELTLDEAGKMVDIVKDCSEIMKNTVKIKKYFQEHSEKKI